MESTGCDNNFGLGCHVKKGVISQRSDLNEGRARVAFGFGGIHNPDSLVLHEKVVVGPGVNDGSVVAEPGMGAERSHRMLSGRNPADSLLVAIGTFLGFLDP
jgi:hypothetical protein